MEHLSNEEKIKEICECSHCSLIEDVSPQQKKVTCKRCVLSHKVREMAQWKDEQYKQEKQQWIDKACVAHCNNCYTRYGNCQEDSYKMQCQRYVNFKKAMKGE